MEIISWMTALEVVLLFLIPASLGGEVRCGDGEWIQGHRGCYAFETELKSWEEARQDCQNRGGFLLSIGSVAELRYVKDEMKPKIKNVNLLKWWVGLRPDPGQSGSWKWADGGEFNNRVSPWSPGEPNNADANEDCVEFNFKGKLNDASCSDSHPYVCEKIGGTTTTETTVPSGTVPVSSKEGGVGSTTASRRNTQRGSASTRRRGDTKGPPVRVTTSDLPEAPFPESTPTGTVSNTRSSDVQPDFSTKASTTRTSSSGPQETPKIFCDSSITAGLDWPATRTGTTARVACANGVATWRCVGFSSPQWEGEPNIDDCASSVLKEVFTAVTQAENGPEMKVSVQEVAKAVSSLADITEKRTMSPQDVVLTSRALSALATHVDLEGSSKEEIRDVVTNVVKATSNLLSDNKTSTWSKLPKEDQKRSAASLLEGVESSAMAIAEVLTEPQVIKQKDDNIDLELVVLDSKLLEEPVVYGSEENVDQFVIPSDMLTDGDQEGLTKIVFVTYHKIADLLQPEETEQSPQDDGHDAVPARLVVSNVISVSVHDRTFHNLRTPIKFTMKHTKVYPSDAHPSCVFWKFAKGSHKVGEWSVEGCEVVRSNASHTVCQCNHLTNFAVLMDVQQVQISDVHEMSLQLITYVGCIISAVCLIVSWLTFNFLKCLQGERNSIHKNLVFCLFVAEMLFLFGIDKTYNRILCGSLAGLMHYFFLAAFTWMFVEGVHIVVMIVQVFDAAKSRMRWYYMAGYGIPSAIVVVSAAVNYEGYGTDKYCWLSVENYFIWSFAGPLAIILLVNATILTYAMSTVCKHSEYVIKEKNRSDSTRAWIQGALALEVLLGLTWVFGYFYINQETIVMAYIFTVLNSLQGVFIFCFHCLLNKKVRKEYKRVLDISRVTSSTNTRSATRSSLHRKQDPSYEMYAGSQ